MIALGFLLFGAAEIATFVAVAGQLGFLWALLILIGVSALGPMIVRRVGLPVLARTQDRLAAGENPTRDVLDGLVVLIGGIAISVPGFISDALGLLLMLSPVRQLTIRAVGRRLARRVRAVRADRWRVVDARSYTTSGPPSGGSDLPHRPLEPGDPAGR